MIKSSFPLVVVSPHPANFEAFDGWSQRIHDIDKLLSQHTRLYVNLSTGHLEGIHDGLRKKTHNSYEICLNPDSKNHLKLLEKSVFPSAKLIYIQTLHHAAYVQLILGETRFIVDIHGVVPEEESMLGNADNSIYFETVEADILKRALLNVVVSNNMRNHFAGKYSDLKSDSFLTLAIKPNDVSIIDKPKSNLGQDLPVKVVYLGGTQVWQNVSEMFELAELTNKFSSFSLYSADLESLRKHAKQFPDTNVVIGFTSREELRGIYEENDFGLIIRNESIVNKVASPTKLFEYLANGVIPVIKYPMLGDFYDLGYRYITVDEFSAGFFPDNLPAVHQHDSVSCYPCCQSLDH